MHVKYSPTSKHCTPAMPKEVKRACPNKSESLKSDYVVLRTSKYVAYIVSKYRVNVGLKPLDTDLRVDLKLHQCPIPPNIALDHIKECS